MYFKEGLWFILLDVTNIVGELGVVLILCVLTLY